VIFGQNLWGKNWSIWAKFGKNLVKIGQTLEDIS
jgi:hypothetical protein